jgi:inorganic pyrophosphatase
MEFDVVVEIPRGSRNKYEADHETGRIRLDRTLFTATQYPADYGFVPDTLGEDGDPLDGDPRQENLRELEDIPEFYQLEIHHFFTVYKELEPGKGVRDTAWAGRLAAEAEVEASRRRLRELGG